MSESQPTFELMTSLQVMTCSVCGVVHAVPALLHLERVSQGGTLHCPNGHALRPDMGAHADLLQKTIRQAAEIQQLMHQVNALQMAAAANATSAGEAISDQEAKRRAGVVASRTEREIYGRKICGFCGNLVKGSYLKSHLLNQHRAELAAMPAARFM